MSDPRRVWGDDRARPRLLNGRLALGSDPDTVYVFGESDGSVQLEAWHAATGVRVSAWAVARGARLVPGELRRGEQDDEVLLAVRGVARTEVIAVDLATGSTRGCLVLPREAAHLSSIARDGATAAGADDTGAFVATSRHLERLLPCFVAVSQDGALAASATFDQGSVRLLDVGTGTTLGWLDLPGEARNVALSFSGGDATLWATGQGEVTCWDLASRVTLGRWRGVFGRERPAAFSPDGLRALFDRPIALAVGHERAVDHRAAAWDGVDARVSPDGRRLAAGAGVLSWTDLARDRHVELTGTGHTAAVRALAASSDGARVASCAGDATMRVWDAASGACEWVLEGDPSGYDAVAFAPDGRTLYATTAAPRRLTAWSLADGTETTPRELPMPGDGLQVSPDGRTLVARRTTTRPLADACVVDLARFAPLAPWLSQELAALGVNPRAGVALGLSRGGSSLEAFGHDPAAVGATFDLASGARTATALELVGGAPRAEAFSSDGRWLVTARAVTDAVEVVFYAVGDGYNVSRRCRFRGRLSDVPIAVGDHVAAVAEADGYVTVADRRDGRTTCVATLRSQATALALSPDEKTLYVGTHNGQVRVYSV